jgi:hypothetical protein
MIAEIIEQEEVNGKSSDKPIFFLSFSNFRQPLVYTHFCFSVSLNRYFFPLSLIGAETGRVVDSIQDSVYSDRFQSSTAHLRSFSTRLAAADSA